MLLFGLGPASKIAFGVLLGFFPIALAVLAGIRAVDRQFLTVARAFGAGAGASFVKVVLPAISGTLCAGLRTGLALTVVGVIVGEVLGAREGLGYLITYAYGRMRTADYAALALLALVVVVVLDGAGAWVEARARRWTG
jgi:ABC-type nitrate/sulfonate/bicarbonate transport system permease component